MDEFPLLLPPELGSYTTHPLLRTGISATTRPQFDSAVVLDEAETAPKRVIAPRSSLQKMQQVLFLQRAKPSRALPWMDRQSNRIESLRSQIQWIEANVNPNIPRELLIDLMLDDSAQQEKQQHTPSKQVRISHIHTHT